MTKLPVDTKDFQKCLCELLLLESLSFSDTGHVILCAEITHNCLKPSLMSCTSIKLFVNVSNTTCNGLRVSKTTLTCDLSSSSSSCLTFNLVSLHEMVWFLRQKEFLRDMRRVSWPKMGDELEITIMIIFRCFIIRWLPPPTILFFSSLFMLSFNRPEDDSVMNVGWHSFSFLT